MLKTSVAAGALLAGTVAVILTVVAHPVQASTSSTTASAVLSATETLSRGPAVADRATVGYPAVTGAGRVVVPRRSDEGIRFHTGGGDVMTLGLPRAGVGSRLADAPGTVVYTDSDPSYDVAVQTTARGGARALVTIHNTSAPHDLAFPLSLPNGVHPTIEQDGSVSLVDREGISVGGFARSWAKDATGQTVGTTFTLHGSTLIQHVAFGAQTAFPVVADPDGW